MAAGVGDVSDLSQVPAASVEIRIRNNRLRRARLEMGLSQAALARAAGVSVMVLCALETLREDPRRWSNPGRSGKPAIVIGWRKPVLVLSEYLGISPEDLFPEELNAIKQPRVEREVEVSTLLALTGEAPMPDHLLEQSEDLQWLEGVLAELPERTRAIVLARADGQTGAEVGTGSASTGRSRSSARGSAGSNWPRRNGTRS